jgi:hypothetical protein
MAYDGIWEDQSVHPGTPAGSLEDKSSAQRWHSEFPLIGRPRAWAGRNAVTNWAVRRTRALTSSARRHEGFVLKAKVMDYDGVTNRYSSMPENDPHAYRICGWTVSQGRGQGLGGLVLGMDGGTR